MTSKAVPMALGWKVVVLPRKGKTESAGGIDISAAADSEAHLNYIGEIIDMGEAAFMARTKSGIDMSAWKRRPEIGDFVIYTPYAGMRIRRSGDGPLEWIILMNDTDIQAIIDDPYGYYSWIDS